VWLSTRLVNESPSERLADMIWECIDWMIAYTANAVRQILMPLIKGMPYQHWLGIHMDGVATYSSLLLRQNGQGQQASCHDI
jgi:hypothetical protein